MVDEFDLIKKLFVPLAGGRPEALNLADDVALIAGPSGQQWAMTTDAMVAGVHFFPDDPPDLIAKKLVRVNLSDLAAKGAEPCFLLMTTCFPTTTGSDWLDRFASGLKADCDMFKVALIGGDTVATPGPLVLSLTAVGKVAENEALLRSNARSGDHVWLSGTLGDAALGLLVAKGEGKLLSGPHADALLDRYRLPRPRVALGPRLRGLAHAAMDVSDGLLGDLGHLCRASNLAAEIEAERLPLSPAAQAALAAGLGEGLTTVVSGGDDYEILFTAPPDADRALGALAEELDLRLTRIGRMRPGSGVALLDGSGQGMPSRAGRLSAFFRSGVMKKILFIGTLLLLLALAGLGAAGHYLGKGPLAPYLYKTEAVETAPPPVAHRILYLGEIITPLVRNHAIEEQVGMDIDIDVFSDGFDKLNNLLPLIDHRVRMELYDFLPNHSDTHSDADRQAVHDRVMWIVESTVGPGVIRDVTIRTFYTR